jgi:hypothetical protein
LDSREESKYIDKAFIPMALNGKKGLSHPLTSIRYINNARAIADHPAE